MTTLIAALECPCGKSKVTFHNPAEYADMAISYIGIACNACGRPITAFIPVPAYLCLHCGHIELLHASNEGLADGLTCRGAPFPSPGNRCMCVKFISRDKVSWTIATSAYMRDLIGRMSPRTKQRAYLGCRAEEQARMSDAWREVIDAFAYKNAVVKLYEQVGKPSYKVQRRAHVPTW